jgi:hypothetical protein
MNIVFLIGVALVVLAIASLPTFGFFPGNYGYYPSGGLVTILLILLLLRLLGII